MAGRQLAHRVFYGVPKNLRSGGTGAYRGATGDVDVDFENDTFTLHLLIPNQ